jgi:ribosomal protein S18 acetylase RimI-like enzyme
MDLLALDRVAFRAWPAEEAEERDGWVLRAMRGVTRRANSVWTSETLGFCSLSDRIAQAESFYLARGLPSTFTVGSLSPADLDAELERRGYAIDAPVSVQTARAEAIPKRASLATTVTRTPSSEFLSVVVERGRYAHSPEIFSGLLSRLGSSALYASSTSDGEPCAAGLGVLSGDLLGIFAMLTLASVRRRGLGEAVLSSLVDAGRERGARTVYLQVERDNEPALRLYKKLGFQEAYGYHYRVRRAAMDGG